MSTTHTLPDGTVLARGGNHKNGNALDGNHHEADPFPKRLTLAEKRSASKLTSFERTEWLRALKLLEKGWKTFVEVGLSLKKIRESRLYREDHDSWEAFCRAVVGISKTEANRQIIDAEVVEALKAPNGVTGEEEALLLPSNRAQARALARVKGADERQQLWKEIIAKSPGTPITAQVIEEAITPSNPLACAERTVKSGCRDLVSSPVTGSVLVLTELDVLETLMDARRKADWTLVDAVIDHLKAQRQ